MNVPIPEPASLGHGIHLIPAPLPFKSPAWVNTYAIEADGGILLLDCGTDWEPGREAIRDGFRRLGLEESAVHTLVVSHLHLDHVGMSARLVSELGCRFVMHERAAKLVDRYNDTPGYVDRLLRIGRTHGVPSRVLGSVTGDLATRPEYMPLIDPPDHTVADGERIDIGDGRSLEVIHTPGHEPAHICLRDSRTGILFSGDHVLPRISPVIMWDEDLGDPLGNYLASLQKLLGMNPRNHLPGTWHSDRPGRREGTTDPSPSRSPAARHGRAGPISRHHRMGGDAQVLPPQPDPVGSEAGFLGDRLPPRASAG